MRKEKKKKRGGRKKKRKISPLNTKSRFATADTTTSVASDLI